MSKVTFSAPGKVVLAGEYAVLDGAPAICMAVDRRARVTISRGNKDHHTVMAPGYSGALGRFTSNDGHFEWLEGGQDFALVEHVWQAADINASDHLALSLDSDAFVDTATGSKIGIGSSAALCAALSKAMSEIAAANIEVHQIAMAAHRSLQHGAGSGVDIACSLAGGLIEYRVAGETAQSRQWPDGLKFALLWSGVPASTTGKLRDLAAHERYPSRQTLGAAAEDLASHWSAGSVAEILHDLRRYTAALRAFSIDHDLGIFDAGHAELDNAAAASGLVYKPCGAGGGDLGIVLADSAAAIDAFIDLATRFDFKHLNMRIDPLGVRRDKDEH